MEKKIELRSEEVQDIISQVPGWLLRWGISLIFILFIALLATSWFIRYPDVIKATVVVTTNPAPITLVSRASGKILLLKKSNEVVKKDEVIAILQTNARYEDVLNLERIISQPTTKQNFAEPMQVGELQSFLNSTTRTLQEWTAFQKNDLHQKQIAHLQKQIGSYKRLNQNLQNQLSLMRDETSLSHQQFKTDSLLLSQKVIAPLDFNKTKSSYLIQQRSLKNTEASIISNQLQIGALEKQLTELEIDKNTKEGQLQTNYTNSLNELAAQLKKWKESYLFTAAADGTLAYLGFIENDQFIESNKPLFAVLPYSNQLIAKAEMPVTGAGKVKVGQAVNIRLHNYPFEQFGMITGKVESISDIPEKEKYTVTIHLPNGMTSTYNKKLNFTPQLQGETEIITEDLRVLERVFYQIRKFVVKR
ncbi:MAG: HlyD family secretion protein [Bacteroidota bacterium]|jgi:multidrug efflux pump subunit AcrA (membrane-fusion protein)|nr:HlyD family efflux transporter periplasmic adaptor subunit [Cytophagales bacterium]